MFQLAGLPSLRPHSSPALIAILTLGLFCASSPQAEAQVTDFKRGDVDGSGCLDTLIDTITLLQFLFPNAPTVPPLPCESAADANDDGAVNFADAVFLLGAGFTAPGGTPNTIAAPGPDVCGTDPTPDTLTCAVYDNCNACILPPTDPNVELRLVVPPMSLTNEFIVDLRLDTAYELYGLSLGVCHTPGGNPTSVTIGADLAALLGGAGPQFFSPQIDPQAGWALGVIVTILGTDLIPIGTNLHIAEVTYQCAQNEVTGLSFCDTIGSPALPVSVSLPNAIGIRPVTTTNFLYCGTALENTIRRGDVNADSSLDTFDAFVLEQFIIPGDIAQNPPIAPVGCDLAENESGDVNDNEVTGLADYLRLRQFLDCGIAFPSAGAPCQLDTNQGTAGFDVIDPNYRLFFSNFTLTGPDADVRFLDIPISVQVPSDIYGITFGMEWKPGISLLDVPFTPAPGVIADVVGFEKDGNTTFFSIGTTSCDAPIQSFLDVDPAPIGTLHLAVSAGVAFDKINFLAEAELGGQLRRSTIIDAMRLDHQPQLIVGDGAHFLRGNSNNDPNLSVDIGDAVRILGHLFPSPVSLPLPCRDAADANNDGRIDIGDPIRILDYLFASGPLLAEPFPFCGIDADIDAIDILCSQESFFCCDGPVCP